MGGACNAVLGLKLSLISGPSFDGTVVLGDSAGPVGALDTMGFLSGTNGLMALRGTSTVGLGTYLIGGFIG